MTKNFYITTTLPYVNASPHIGFALEIIQADVVARYQRLIGNNVVFNFGTDEHGQKIYQKAIEENKDPKNYVDEYAKKYDDLKSSLNLSYDKFIRTTDPKHKRAAQEIWKLCQKKGYIEKGKYKAKYCVGCELEKQDSDLEDGVCPLHPNQKLQTIEEENYFFKFSKLEKDLLDLYKKCPDLVIPEHRQKEIENFVKDGLHDFSISRLKEKLPWGIPVPGDDKHVMYVWFDALTNYISTLGWPEDKENFKKFWGTKEKPNAIQVAGKDNLRQQAAMWQAMLLAADLPPTKQILIHGFITSNGQKMSKSLGNVVDPFEYVEKYETDALRYYLLAKISPTEDSDFTKEKFEKTYNADLANGLGNLVARLAKLCEKINFEFNTGGQEIFCESTKHTEKYEFSLALKAIWKRIKKLDININNAEPWQLLKEEKNDLLAKFLLDSVRELLEIAYFLKPYLPETSEKIFKQFHNGKIKSQKPLFPRI